DADIYLRESNPPNVIKWGKRVYYYNCHREGGDYAWHKDNLPATVSVNDINSSWAFDGKWDPAKVAAAATDPVAENMLLYQRANGGWPKHFQGNKNVDYNHQLTDDEMKELQAGYAEGKDATIDNEATTKEIKYLVKQYKQTANTRYLRAAEKGVQYLLEAQYANGGWPQYYPDFSLYRSQVTYNDNAMVNVLNVLMDIVKKKNGMEVIDTLYYRKAVFAVQRGIDCILKTQVKQNGVLTAWCAQYDAKTLTPAKARMFELPSLSGMESVGIVRFLMRIDEPSPEVVNAVNSAVKWFDKVRIKGYKFVFVDAPNEKSGKDRVMVPDPTAPDLWARFYDLETNEPFFTGRDSERKKTVAEIENERRIGYAWYGTWPQKLLDTEYPEWKGKKRGNNN
ncbi:MAG TPA: pectate lyase, partial [Ferruginibacter sp.]|nr:pectate lyase [Ferruginibacter sp.]